jgi:uncharacterized Rmd1/YagE family protein
MKLRAINIPNRIKFKEICNLFHYETIYSNNYERVYKVQDNQYLLIYSFGVYVLADISGKEATKLTKRFKQILNYTDKFEAIEELVIASDDIMSIRISSLVLAQSVALEYWEQMVDDCLDKTLVYSKALHKHGKYPTNRDELLKFIGLCATVRQEILSNIYVSGTLPDDAWDDPRLEKLFLKLKDTFDIEPRFRSINLSLDSIRSSNEIMVDLIHNRRNMIGEWIIIGLIGIEIVLTLVDKIWK